ncbi:hypothetical protein GC163_13290 [bacterium]|nr:hypothetical protein [bacterium]
MTRLSPRSLRRLRASLKKSESQRTRAEPTSKPYTLPSLQGLLVDDLDAPDDFDSSTEQDLRMMVRRDDKLTLTETTYKVKNRDPSLQLDKGAYVVCLSIAGEWRIVWASCDTYEDLLE